MTFDATWATGTVRALKAQGVHFVDGLSETQLHAIAHAFGCDLPPELREFLSAGCPTSKDWAKWSGDASAVAKRAEKWITGAFTHDIRHNGYWHSSFGTRPPSVDAAVGQAREVIGKAPPLIPIYGHRFLVAGTNAPRPVLSVWQATDSILYGHDLADYFANEFSIPRPDWAAADSDDVPVWTDLFGL